jgi:hypothetical protein
MCVEQGNAMLHRQFWLSRSELKYGALNSDVSGSEFTHGGAL